MLIDIHAHAAQEHVLPEAFFDGWVDNLQRLMPAEVPLQRSSLSSMFRRLNDDPGCDRLVAEMDAAGIDKTVLLIVDFGFAFPSEYDRLSQIYELHRELMRAHEGRFIVFAGIDPRRGRSGLDLVERAFREFGFRGLKIYPPCGYSPASPELDPFYELCEAYGAPVLSHVGPTSPTLSFKFTRPEEVDEAAFRFPRVNFILGHAAVVWRHEAAMIASYRPNIYLDLSGFQSAWKRGELDSILSEHKRMGLLRKLLFGTDWPIHRITMDQKRCVAVFRDCAERGILTATELEWIFHKNAADILSKDVLAEPISRPNRIQSRV